MALIRATTSGSSGGGGVGYNEKFTANTSTPVEVDLGYAPSVAIAYMVVSNTAIVLNLDLDTGNIIQTANSGFEYDNTSFFSSSFYKSGNKVYYKAANSGYAVTTRLIVY